MAVIGEEIIRLKEIGSTNRYLMDLVSVKRPAEGALVITDRQTAGRGTDGSAWESEPGMNLTFSFVLYPYFLPVEAQFYLNKAVSLGIADCIAEVLPGRHDIRIKWPNDIYIGDKKLAGTLIQNGVKGSRLEFSVIGIGLNVNQELFTGDAPNPISLKMVTGKQLDLKELLGLLTSKIENRYDLLKQGEGHLLDQNYLKHLYRIDQVSSFIYKAKHIMAKITGVNQYGQLVLQLKDGGIIECDLKEISFEPLPPSPPPIGGGVRGGG